MKRTSLLPALLATVLFCAAGCRRTEPPPMKLAMGVPDGAKKYSPVSAKNLTLKLTGKKDLPAGEKAELIYSLIYTGNGKKTISEWYSNENDNITLFIQPYLTGMKEPSPDNWIELAPVLKQPIFHHPLILMPGNRVMVVKQLPFIEKLRVSPGKMRRYFIKAKINLASLDLCSDVDILQVFHKEKPMGEF